MPCGGLMLQDIRYGRFVEPRVAGRNTITPKELEIKLGSNCFLIWRKLLWCRNEKGITHATLQTLATANIAEREWQALSRDQANRGVRRLLKVGLVRNLGWRKVGGRSKNPLRQRVVYGAFMIDANKGELVAVPVKTLKALEGLGRGGARAGSGRKKAAVLVPEECKQDSTSLNQSRHPGQAQSFQSRQHREAPVSVFKAANIIPLGISKEIESIDVLNRDFSKERKMPTGVGPSFLSLKVGEGSHGVRMAGDDASRPRGDDRLLDPEVPKFPDGSVVDPPRVPNPPLLDGTLPDKELAEALTRTYRAVVTARTGKPCWQFARGDISKSKQFKTLVRAARQLIEHELPPASWLAWSFDKWEFGDNTKRAPLNWLLGTKRIEERRGWFRKEMADYGGGRLLPGPQLKELWRAYMAMRADLVGSSAPVAEIIDKHFPGRMYRLQVSRARAESAQIQDDMRAKAARGEFLW